VPRALCPVPCALCPVPRAPCAVQTRAPAKIQAPKIKPPEGASGFCGDLQTDPGIRLMGRLAQIPPPPPSSPCSLPGCTAKATKRTTGCQRRVGEVTGTRSGAQSGSRGCGGSSGQVVPRSITWNPMSTIRSTGLPSMRPKRASAARWPMAARSIRTVDNGGNV
jgi:hypothetical protein